MYLHHYYVRINLRIVDQTIFHCFMYIELPQICSTIGGRFFFQNFMLPANTNIAPVVLFSSFSPGCSHIVIFFGTRGLCFQYQQQFRSIIICPHAKIIINMMFPVTMLRKYQICASAFQFVCIDGWNWFVDHKMIGAHICC